MNSGYHLRIDKARTANFGSEMVQAKHVSGKNIFCSMNEEKIRKKEFLKLYIVLLRAELNCTIEVSRKGRVAGVSKKENVRFQKLFFH